MSMLEEKANYIIILCFKAYKRSYSLIPRFRGSLHKSCQLRSQCTEYRRNHVDAHLGPRSLLCGLCCTGDSHCDLGGKSCSPVADPDGPGSCLPFVHPERARRYVSKWASMLLWSLD